VNANAKKWVKALRSGKYKQARYRLRRDNKYCCLGVACDISKLGKWDGTIYLDSYLYLPRKVQKWLGLRSSGGEYYTNNLTSFNDNNWSFKKIADIIESEPNGLFKKNYSKTKKVRR
jgi:hypothetical protein